MTSLVEQIHGKHVHQRRVRKLCQHLSACLGRGERVLDVGCGDGLLASLIMQGRPDVTIDGIDVLVREGAAIPVRGFDGRKIPAGDGSYDAVMFVDVLHHTDDPMVLLREAARVARKAVVIKDHTRDGIAAGATLRYMDRVGNGRYGVALPYNYWPEARWREAFRELRLEPSQWERKLMLYPAPFDWVFGRGLHFVARLEAGGAGASASIGEGGSLP